MWSNALTPVSALLLFLSVFYFIFWFQGILFWVFCPDGLMSSSVFLSTLYLLQMLDTADWEQPASFAHTVYWLYFLKSLHRSKVQFDNSLLATFPINQNWVCSSLRLPRQSSSSVLGLYWVVSGTMCRSVRRLKGDFQTKTLQTLLLLFPVICRPQVTCWKSLKMLKILCGRAFKYPGEGVRFEYKRASMSEA